jgi:DNA recombination protein RmuC
MNVQIVLLFLACLICGGAIGFWMAAKFRRLERDAARAEGRGDADAEVARLTERCAQQEEGIRSQSGKIQRLDEELAKAGTRGSELERHNAQLLERVESLPKLEAAHAEALRANTSLAEQLTSQREITARFESAARSAADVHAQLQQRIDELTTSEGAIRENLAAREVQLSDSRQQCARLQVELQASKREREDLFQSSQQLQSLAESLRSEVGRLTSDTARMQATIDAERQASQSLAAGREILLAQFKTLSAEVLEEKSKAFTEQNSSALTQLLSPMKEQFAACTNEFKEVNRIAGQERVALGEQFKALVQQSQAVGVQAENLTKALKGDQKTQGTWGEIVLESLLELAGLVEGTHFDCQRSFSTEEEGRSIPDVVLKLPNERHLVIDAKMSLTAYERAVSCTAAEEREAYLKQHVNSVRAHIKALASKNYQEIYQLKSLDFVLLFVPVESAFAAAVSNDNQLFRDAWDKNVIVVSPSTLLFVVRTVAYLWRQETQVRNVRDIAKRGAALYDKLCGFVSDLEDVGKHMARSRSAYESAFKKLRTGEGNVIRQAEMLKELGVKPTKKLAESLLDDDMAGGTLLEEPTEAQSPAEPSESSASLENAE